jgi:AAA+ ATPase superfamily predicted ATPase
MKFIGRTKELEDLNLLLRKRSASFIVIRGRRRVGKSRLIKEFISDKKSWTFAGPPPVPGMTKQRQLDIFSTQLAQNLNMPKIQVQDWNQHFAFLGSQIKNQKLVIVFDEISWMGSEDPDFLGHLKNAWDLDFSNNPGLILILCGSVSSWIEQNILASTGFVGRVSVDMVLEELSIADAQEFWGSEKTKVSPYEKFKVLSVTGGIPKYLEEIIPEQSAERNIQRLCFQSQGLLFREYDQIFSELFSKKSYFYSQIVTALSKQPLNLDEICDELEIEKSGVISDYLHDLVLAGFISEDGTWNLKSKQSSQLKKFRLRDNYLRFYLKYIQPHKDQIELGVFETGPILNFPGWEVIMGLQFENLVVNNLKGLCKILGISMQEIIMAGPFFQRKTQRQKGCQIDLLIQTRSRTLYVCEVKFNSSEVSPSVIEEVKLKIKHLSIPRGYSVRPVLIHVNGVHQRINESELFSHIVDFSEFL